MEGHFSRLASELNLDERSRLLEKLNSQSNLQQGPLYEEEAAKTGPPLAAELRYQTLPWYRKLWFAVLGVFNNRSPVKLYEDFLMAKMARSVEDKAPGLYNYQRDLLLPKFREMLVYLRDASRFFYNALDASLNRDRGGLMVFLGSLEMPDIHRKIQETTDPAALAKAFPGVSDVELTQKAHRAAEDVLAGITAEQRGSMYLNARSLNCLKQLSAFHFDRIINIFSADVAAGGSVCSAASIRDYLIILNNVLYSLREPPAMTLLESLFIYVLAGREDEPGFDIQSEMRKLLTRAEASLEIIRDFNQQVPLTYLLRCMSRDMTFVPSGIGGGEDWFVIFRDHWKSIIDEKFFAFIRTRKERELQNSFKRFLKGTSLRLLDNMSAETNSSGIPVKGALNLSFLQTFYAVVFMPDLNKILRPMLLDGEFTNRENKTEFTECYNNLIKLEDVIRNFDSKLAPDGDFGKRYAFAKSEMTALPVKRRKIQIVLDEACAVAGEILEQTRFALSGLIKILGGVISPGERYGALSNLAAMSKTPGFAEGIQSCVDQFGQALKLMDEIDVMEARQ